MKKDNSLSELIKSKLFDLMDSLTNDQFIIYFNNCEDTVKYVLSTGELLRRIPDMSTSQLIALLETNLNNKYKVRDYVENELRRRIKNLEVNELLCLNNLLKKES